MREPVSVPSVAARKRELEDLKNPHGKAVTKEAWEELERELKLA